MRIKLSIAVIFLFSFTHKQEETRSWIRINQLGYQPGNVKVAVWCSKDSSQIKTFQLIDAVTKKFVFNGTAGKAFGS